MSDQEHYFFETISGPSFSDYPNMNASLREQGASFQYGPPLNEEGQPFWGSKVGDSSPTGIYRRREAFGNPAQAKISLADAFRLEAIARLNYSAYAPDEPKLSERYYSL